jgi:hypothetical protein
VTDKEILIQDLSKAYAARKHLEEKLETLQGHTRALEHDAGLALSPLPLGTRLQSHGRQPKRYELVDVRYAWSCFTGYEPGTFIFYLMRVKKNGALWSGKPTTFCDIFAVTYDFDVIAQEGSP